MTNKYQPSTSRSQMAGRWSCEERVQKVHLNWFSSILHGLKNEKERQNWSLSYDSVHPLTLSYDYQYSNHCKHMYSSCCLWRDAITPLKRTFNLEGCTIFMKCFWFLRILKQRKKRGTCGTSRCLQMLVFQHSIMERVDECRTEHQIKNITNNYLWKQGWHASSRAVVSISS